MKKVEKILEEIDGIIERYKENPRLEIVDICYGLNQAKRIIRKHLSCENGSEITRSSRDTVDGWISVEERLPAEGEAVLITTDVGLIATGYIHCCEWITGVEPDYPIAWRPLPEPYRPERRVEE